MPQETNMITAQKTFRPLFLTVLCTITLIASIAGLVSYSKGYFNAKEEVERITSGKAKSQLKILFGSGKGQSAELVRIGNLTVDNYQKFSVGCFASYLLCLVGTVLIFQLKRTGFYSFTLGTFFNLITHFLLFGDNFSAMGLSILGALGGLVFVILYGLNLKYMEESQEVEA